ncbi:MAG: hypothetical protein EOO75_16900 [Myxococcales bacterium]|nr:MAG: hypothetical protein EOO75_16900 [Myxococcales bacterium]
MRRSGSCSASIQVAVTSLGARSDGTRRRGIRRVGASPRGCPAGCPSPFITSMRARASSVPIAGSRSISIGASPRPGNSTSPGPRRAGTARSWIGCW